MYDCTVIYHALCICIDFLKIRGQIFFLFQGLPLLLQQANEANFRTLKMVHAQLHKGRTCVIFIDRCILYMNRQKALEFIIGGFKLLPIQPAYLHIK